MLNTEAIKDYNLFAGLDESELEEIARLCEREMYEVDTVIFSPSITPPDIFLLEKGNDAIQIEVPVHESTVVIHTLSKGESFGWAPLCPVPIHTAIARVMEPASVIRINGAGLVSLCNRNCHTGYVIMKNVSGIINTRLEYTTLVLRHKLQMEKKLAV